jgi:DNA polymerase bacteriophage-type
MTGAAKPCFIDFETRSPVDLKKTGVHVYAEHPQTEVLLASYAFGLDGPMHRWRRGERMPHGLSAHIYNGGKLVAHNTEFERVIWQTILGPRLGWTVPTYEQWECTASMASAMALPRNLEDLGAALGLGVQKDKEGHRLMLQMSKPRKVNPDGSVTWWEEPEKLDRLHTYCDRDVETMQAAYPRLRPLPPEERATWLLDAQINDRGVFVDAASVRAAKKVIAGAEKAMTAELQLLTTGEVSTAKQIDKFMGWLAAQGAAIPSLARADVEAALAGPLPPAARRALEIRLELSKSSTSKLEAMLARRCADGRARGNLVYHAATTGRWAGTGIQMQNLPRGTIKKAERCLTAISTGDYRAVEIIWDSAHAAVSSAIRSMFTAGPGNVILAADFSNIEGRVLAWLAGEQWKVKAFEAYDTITGYDAKGKPLRAGPDLYKLAYSVSFGIPVDRVDDDQRQIGKVQELALGFQGGKGAFHAMAQGYGVTVSDERAAAIAVAWRNAHPATVSFWYNLEQAAMDAIRKPGAKFSAGRIIFGCAGGYLWAQLPSRRLLAYPNPSIQMRDSFVGRKETICFSGFKGTSRAWGEATTYGGKLAENVTQATARDVMRDAMLRITAAGIPIILSVHDEVVAEVPEGRADVKAFEALMAQLPPWAAGLPVAAEGWSGHRYRK